MRITRTRAHHAAVSAALAVLLAACATSGPVLQAWTAPPMGSTWEMEHRNTGSYGATDVRYTVTRGSTTWKGAPAVALVNSLGITTMSDPATGRFMSFVDRNGKEMISFDPPIGWDYPLHVGKTWSRQNQRMTLHASGKTLEYEFSCKVEDFEQVKVVAGSFGAFRIRCASSIGSEEIYWASPDLGGGWVKTQLRRGPTSPLGAGTQQAELVSRGTR